MRLLEVEVRNWRGLSSKLAVLSPRLNLILGPNESGKSRLFQAVRFGLFESYKGIAQHKQLLQSWTSSESPFVRISFADGDVQYELQKQFLKGASAQLVGAGTTLRAEDAEEALRTLVGARHVGGRAANSADLGIWPLLMVPQGESRKALHEDMNDYGRGQLQERLSKEIGVAAISATGQRLMVLAEQEYNRFFTATGQEAKTLRDARAELNAAEMAFVEASEATSRQEQTAATLADKRRELLDLDARAQSAKQDAEAMRVRAEAVQAAGGRVAIAQGTLNTATARASNAEAALNSRTEADNAVERLTNELSKLESELARREITQRELDQAVQRAEGGVAAAEAEVRAARAAIDAAQREKRRVELTEARQDLTSRIASLERLDRAVTEARANRAALPMIDTARLEQLNSLDRAARAAAAQLQGAAVSVVVHLRQKAAVDGMAHEAGEQVHVDVVENRRISIGEIADVEVRPGGGALDRLRDAKVTADSALAAALRGAGATDLGDAATIHTSLTALDGQIGQLLAEAKATSAKSFGQLREEFARQDADIERLGPESESQGDAALLTSALELSDSKLVDARGTREAANAAVAECRSVTAGFVASAQRAREENDRITHLYTNRPKADDLRVAQAGTIAERERAQAALAAAQREFADLGGGEAQADARRLAQAQEGLAKRVRDARTAVDQLQGTLQAMMEAGNYENVQQAGALVEQARTNLWRLERQAAAAQRLWQVLSEERRRVIDSLTAPVTLRVKPYLQDLSPGSSLDAGEGLEVIGLQSGDLKEPFTELSGGAQEQISLLTRIGMAEVLAGDGTLPLILDDALINTDPERIKRVHRALFRAADKLQVILFSCHDVLFDGLGAEFVAKLEKGRH